MHAKTARRKAPAQAAPELSLIVPLYNESENVEGLAKEIESALDGLGRSYEIILVDDGSRDGTGDKIERLGSEHPRIRALRLARNYGQSSAMQAGFDSARGEIVVCLDGDLQNDPADIPRMLEALERDGADLVSGWRKHRQDSPARVWLSRAANWLISRLTKVELHDYGCSLKVYRRDAVSNIRLFGEMHRFIPALMADAGATVREIEVNHRPRTHGRSKYRLDRTVRVLLDLVLVLFYTRYRQRPMHFFGAIGLLLAGPGLLICLYLLMLKVGGLAIGDRPLLMLGVLLVVLGGGFIGQGLLAELIVRLLHESTRYPQYRLRAGDDDRDAQ